MKLSSLSLAVLLTLAVPALADQAPPAEMPKTPEGVAATMWDFTKNPEYLKDPKKFVGWLSAALEPSFYTSGLGMQMLDPAMWGVMANSMMHPATYSAWMPLMTDPNVYMKWLAASMDPNFYNAVLGQFSDTGKLMRWVASPVDPKTLGLALQTLNPAMYVKWLTAPLDPRWIQAMIAPVNPGTYLGWTGAALNPATYLKWLTAPLDPRWIQAMIAPVNPGTYLGWTGAALNPASYGELWKGFLTPPTSFAAFTPSTSNPVDPNAAWAQMFNQPGSQPAAPQAGNAPTIFNPLDPNAWSKLLQVPAAPGAR